MSIEQCVGLIIFTSIFVFTAFALGIREGVLFERTRKK